MNNANVSFGPCWAEWRFALTHSTGSKPHE